MSTRSLLAFAASVAIAMAHLPVAAAPPAPAGDDAILLIDPTMTESIEGRFTVRAIPPRLAAQQHADLAGMTFPTLVRERGNSWLFYGHRPADADAAGSPVALLTSRNGLTWTASDEGDLRLPSEVQGGFTPFMDMREDVESDQRFKALARSEDGGLLALASADGRQWRLLSGQSMPASSAHDAFYGRNGAFWSDAEQRYVAFVSEQRDGRRVISRSTSPDFLDWSEPQPIEIEVKDEDLWSATVFALPSASPLHLALLTRTAAGSDGPADICLALSYDGGRTFDRLTFNAWVRPEAGVDTWQGMTASPPVGFTRSPQWVRIPEMCFYVGGNRYELFHNRFVALTAAALTPAFPEDVPGAWDPAEYVSKPFVVTGTALEFNASTDSSGSIKAEFLDEQGQPIAGYTIDDITRAVGNNLWMPANDPEEQRRLFTTGPSAPKRELWGDSAQMRAAWRFVHRGNPENRERVQWFPDWDISELQGRTVQLRILAHGADLYSFTTVERNPQEGEPVEIVAE